MQHTVEKEKSLIVYVKRQLLCFLIPIFTGLPVHAILFAYMGNFWGNTVSVISACNTINSQPLIRV
jgi:hypothetical protein